MKLDLDFDDAFLCKARKRPWPVRLIVLLLTLAVTCGVACSLLADVRKQKQSARPVAPRVPPLVTIRPLYGDLAQPGDPFVIMAPAEIDPRMVVPAPAGDEAMVFNPENGGQRIASGAARPGTHVNPVPGVKPGQVPRAGSSPVRPMPTQSR